MTNPVDMTDADWATIDLEQTATNIGNGVCGICEEYLDPARFAAYWSKRGNPMTYADAHREIGDPDRDFPHYHANCVRDRQAGDI